MLSFCDFSSMLSTLSRPSGIDQLRIHLDLLSSAFHQMSPLKLMFCENCTFCHWSWLTRASVKSSWHVGESQTVTVLLDSLWSHCHQNPACCKRVLKVQPFSIGFYHTAPTDLCSLWNSSRNYVFSFFLPCWIIKPLQLRKMIRFSLSALEWLVD